MFFRHWSPIGEANAFEKENPIMKGCYKMQIGFIGLGIMGKPMAKNLLKAGYSVTAFDVVKPNLDEVAAAGAKAASSIAELSAECNIIITMLPNSPQVKTVVLGEGGVITAAKPGTIVVDMSSIDPMVSIEIEKELQAKGIEMLDAPVSGGEPKAIDGSLSIMVGGKEEIFNKVKDILLVMGGSAVLVGKIGSGNITKLANQIIVAVNIAAMSEGLILASKAGVDPEKVFEAIKGGLAGSTVLNAKAPMVLDRNFKPGFRIELHIKDLNNVKDTAESLGLQLPFATQALEMMNHLKEEGKEKNDHSGLVEYYEELNGVKVERLK